MVPLGRLYLPPRPVTVQEEARMRSSFWFRSSLALGLSLVTLGCGETPSGLEPLATEGALSAEQALGIFEREHRGIGRGSPEVALELGQSPINLLPQRTVKFLSTDPVIHYQPFVLNDVRNLGETAKVVVNNESHILIRGKRYDLAQFHFHRDSEHAVGGRKSAMELHLVHVAHDGAIAVLGVLMETGRRHSALQTLWDAIPAEEGSSAAPGTLFDPTSLLPNLASPYFTYGGSLTTDPFTVGLTWVVYRQSIGISRDQLHQYAEKFEEPNARELQPMAGRTLFERVGGGAN
jgi:carbonic anhydrase